MSEANDSLHSTAYIKVLDLVSEGPIKGLVNGQQSVYFDETPLQNPDGSYNFSDVTFDFRLGTLDQPYISGLPAVENEISVSTELKSDHAWSHSVSNTQLSAVRVRLSVPSLMQTDTSTGDMNGYKVEYAIDVATDGGAFVTVITAAFSGEIVNKYERTHRIDLPAAKAGWTIRVRRITANRNNAYVSDTTTVESITEVIDAKLRYPMSALMFSQLDAKQFSNVPARAFDLYGRILQVPSNYDPDTRSYAGIWDGTFKLAYTDNPAWIYYDLVLNYVYGLGRLLTAAQVDRWALYQIAQRCDELVSDGKGGLEPRFTCNAYIQTRADAYKLLQDLASVFRGVSYWGGGSIQTLADMPVDPVYTYTAANVVDGKFTYAGSSRSTRYTVALVSWNDPSDFYRAKVEYVEDRDGIARYGVVQTELTAFGCTSQGQAQRLGKWTLLTSRLETSAVSFTVGLDSALVGPGKLVRIADPKRAGRRIGGRVRSATADTVVLDLAPTIAAGDSLTVALPSGISETRTVKLVSDNAVTVTAAWSEAVQPEAVWAVESSALTAPIYRIVSITQKEALQFEINAVQHEPQKFDAIDNGTRIDTRPITIIPPSVQPAPASVTLSTHTVIDQGIASTVMTMAWPTTDKAIAYDVEYKKDDNNWVTLPRTGALNAEVAGIYAGQYMARVRAVNALGVSSAPTQSVLTSLTGKTTPPAVPLFLRTTPGVFSIDLEWGFPDGATDTLYTEIWTATNDNLATANPLGNYAYPQTTHTVMGVEVGVTWYYWARLVDRSGNVGAWYPSGAGVAGAATTVESDIIKVIGQIGPERLTPDLLQQMDKVDQLDDDVDALNAQIAQINTSLPDISGRLDLVDSASDAAASAAIELATKAAEAIAGLRREKAISDATIDVDPDTGLISLKVTAPVIDDVSARVRTIEITMNAQTGKLTQVVSDVSGQGTRLTAAESLITQLANSLSLKVDAVYVDNALSAVNSGTDQNTSDIASLASGLIDALTGQATTRQQARAAGVNFASAQQQLNSTADALTAEASARTALAVQLGATQSALVVEQTARATQDDALASNILAAQVRIGNAEAALSSETTARATADAAIASDVSTLKAQLGTTNAAITSEKSARADADTALGVRIDSVQTSLAGVTASVTSETQARTAADSALASQITAINTQLGTANAALASEVSARVDADTALGKRIDTVTASVASAQASVSQEAQTRATADTANALAISQVQTNLNGVSASVTQQAQSINGLSANWTVNLTAGGKVAGVRLAGDASQGTSFDVLANSFRVSLPDGSGSTQVFAIGQVNGVNAVGISGNLIVDGSVGARAMAVDSLSAISASLGNITAGYMRNANGSFYINLNAGANDSVIAGPGFYITPAGLGFFARGLIGASVPVASGQVNINIIGGSSPTASTSINTGIDINLDDPNSIVPYQALAFFNEHDASDYGQAAEITYIQTSSRVARIYLQITGSSNKKNGVRAMNWFLYRN